MKIPDSSILPAKVGLSVVWAIAFACVLRPSAFPSGIATVGKWTFWGMLVAHAIELAAMWMPYVRRAPGSFAGHVVQVVLFGLFHGHALKNAEERASAR
ncbi:MAG: hypothetical protein U0610_06085 [bacterium]